MTLSAMRFELISFAICPYVQRSVITLRYKRIDFDLTHIDLAHPPSWFRDVSPLGKVPVLRIDGTTALFESAVINEFIDEVTEPRLMSADPVERARERAWIAHASTLLGALYRVMSATDRAGLDAAAGALFDDIDPLERFLEPAPLFRGNAFSLADAAFAPLFLRLEIMHAARPFPRWNDYPKTRAWAKALLELPAVAGSVGPSFREDLAASLRKRGSLLAAAL